MRYAVLIGSLLIVLLLVAACGGVESPSTPTATPSPLLPGSITPMPASERYRLDLGAGVVVAFVEGLSPESPDKVAYVTHVPSGSPGPCWTALDESPIDTTGKATAQATWTRS